jgi:hypothetical protein
MLFLYSALEVIFDSKVNKYSKNMGVRVRSFRAEGWSIAVSQLVWRMGRDLVPDVPNIWKITRSIAECLE